jgi:hypothetical protein
MKATGRSDSELKQRSLFAAEYPTEEELSSAIPKFSSWAQQQISRRGKGSRYDDPRLEELVRANKDKTARAIAALFTDATGEKMSVDQVDRCRQVLNRITKAIEQEKSIDWASLPGSMQEKLGVMRRQVRREQEAEFEPRVQAQVQARLATEIKHMERMRAESRRVLDSRKGIITRADFDLIRSCLHPDSRLSVSDQKLAEAFRIFNEAEVLFLDEKECPTTLPSLEDLVKKRRQT